MTDFLTLNSDEYVDLISADFTEAPCVGGDAAVNISYSWHGSSLNFVFSFSNGTHSLSLPYCIFFLNCYSLSFFLFWLLEKKIVIHIFQAQSFILVRQIP